MNTSIDLKINGTMATLIVNGVDISRNVRKYTLTHEAGEIPILTVEMNAISVSVGGGCVSEVPEPWKDFYVLKEPDECIEIEPPADAGGQ